MKWAGGKTQLLPDLVRVISSLGDFNGYHEPFVGGGALFFALRRNGGLADRICLSDKNANLINAYTAVRDDVEEVIGFLERHCLYHSENYFYEIRDIEYEDPREQAARLIYLNKTCFNGLYRENRSGKFNVPLGRYKNPKICNKENLHKCSTALRGVNLEVRCFETVASYAKRGDFVCFDPPYDPLSRTSSFTRYDRAGFDAQAQTKLARVFADLANSGVKVLLSNSDTPFIRDLYKNFEIETVLAKRLVNSKASLRGKINELLIRNF